MILKEIDTSRDDSNTSSSFLGKGKFSRVIRCKIKEESRIPSETPVNSKIKNLQEIDTVHESDFSPELAVKVVCSLIFLLYQKIFNIFS